MRTILYTQIYVQDNAFEGKDDAEKAHIQLSGCQPDSWPSAKENDAQLATIFLPYFQLQSPNSAQEVSNAVVSIKFPKTFSEQILNTKY